MSVDYSAMDFGDYRYEGPTDPNFLQNIGQGGPDPIQGYGTGINRETGQWNPSGAAPGTPELYDYENDPETKRLRERLSAEKALVDKAETDRQKNAIAQARELADTYGLTSLYETMVKYIKEGYNDSAIMSLIKTTPEYKQRFPAMEALAKKNRAITEGQYIEYERRAAELERQFGLPSNMLQGNVTQLLTNEVGMDELNDRVVLASGASVTAPQEF